MPRPAYPHVVVDATPCKVALSLALATPVGAGGQRSHPVILGPARRKARRTTGIQRKSCRRCNIEPSALLTLDPRRASRCSPHRGRRKKKATVMPTKVGTQTDISSSGGEACLGPGLRRDDGDGARAACQRATSQVVSISPVSLFFVSLSVMPMLASSSRMRSDSLEVLALAGFEASGE